MDFTFKSIKINFSLLVVMVICIELIEGMGFCKFQKQFPATLETGCSKNTSVNVTGQMTTGQLVTKISTTIENTATKKTDSNPTSKQQSNIQTTAIEVPILQLTTEPPTTMESVKEEPTTMQMTTMNPATKQDTTTEMSSMKPTIEPPTTMESTKKEPTTMQMTTMNPTTKQPTTTEMSSMKPTIEPPTTMESTKKEPTTMQMTTMNPTTKQPSTKQTSTGKQASSEYTDCYDVYSDVSTKDGIYQIKPMSWPGSPFEVWCNMSDGGGWTVFQRRVDGSENFYLNWESYKHGFGNLSREFWLGNEKLYYLTNQKNYEFRVEFVDKENKTYNLTYDLFCLANESDQFRLKTLGNYMGNPDEVFDYMNQHRNKPFTTKDRDNDDHSTKNCAEDKTGAWWYTKCGTANLNGDYFASYSKSIYVRDSDYDFYKYNIRYTEMKVRPVK